SPISPDEQPTPLHQAGTVLVRKERGPPPKASKRSSQRTKTPRKETSHEPGSADLQQGPAKAPTSRAGRREKTAQPGTPSTEKRSDCGFGAFIDIVHDVGGAESGLPEKGLTYFAFVDMSGGSNDDATLASRTGTKRAGCFSIA